MKQIYKYILTVALLLNGVSAWAYLETSGSAVKQVGSTYYVLYEDNAQTAAAWGGTVDYKLTGPGLKLTFEGKNNCALSTTTTSVSVVDNKSTTLWSGKVNNSYASKTATNNCDVEATKITFKNATATAYKFSFQKVYVTMAKYCEPSSTATINFGSNTYLNSATKTLKIYWSNTADKNITIEGGDGQFTIDKTKVGCSVGKWGNTVVTITYNRTAVGNHSATLTVNGKNITITGTTTAGTPTIDCSSVSASTLTYGQKLSESTITGSDATYKSNSYAGTYSWTRSDASTHTALGCTDYSVTFTPTNTNLNSVNCTIQVPITKVAQTITWAQSGLNIGDLELNGTTSGHDATVYYTSSDESVATISGTTLHMVKPGFVTITAHADATCNYLAADDVSQEFELSRTRPTVTPDVVNMTYGDALSSVTPTCTAEYNGETVTGSFVWVNDAFQPEVGTSTQSAVFTPDDDSRFSAVTVDVTVVVGKADTDLKWRIGATLREYTSYNNPVSTNNSEAAISITTDNALVTYDSDNDMLIVSGPVTEKIVVKITVSQAETTHYKSVSKLYSINVMPKSPVCVDKVYDGNNQWHVDINDENTFNDALAETDGTVVWQESTSTGSGKYLGFNVTYSQYKGIELGNWQEGLSVNSLGSMSDNGVYTQKSVILSITGVPDRVSFSTRVQDVHVKAVFTFDYWATNPHWELFESADMTTWTSVKAWQNTDKSTAAYNVSEQLSPTTRYIKITYKGNFTGTVQDLRITRRHGFEVGADRNQVTTTVIPYFGTEAHPLQVPQTITFRYYSLGSCGSTGDSIAVSSDNENIYADVEGISRNVDFDQYGTYELTVRVTDVNQIGTVTLQATDGASLSIAVASVKPEITATTGIFHTGTEQNQKVAGDCYRGMQLLDFTKCFSGSTPLFDTLYIFGVTGNTELVRNKFDYTDPVLGYQQPKVNVVDDETVCNAHTPMFVYHKSTDRYIYSRTVSNAAQKGLQNMVAGNKKFAVLGYCPYAYTGTDNTHSGFMSFIGNGGQTTDITLIDAELSSKAHTADGRATEYLANQVTLGRGDNKVGGSSAVMLFSTNSTDSPYTVYIHSIGTNQLTAAAGLPITKLNAKMQGMTISGSATAQPSPAIAVQTDSRDTKLDIVIDDKLNGVRQSGSSLDLIPSSGIGSISLGNSNGNLTIDGGTVTLHNGTGHNPLAVAYQYQTIEADGQVAIAYGIGDDYTDNDMLISDGTILGEISLHLPLHTVITGGTFNSGDVICYEEQTLPVVRPTDAEGKKVQREYKQPSSIPSSYHVESVTPDESGKLYPMLPIEELRTQQVKQWIAATPDNDDEASVEVYNKNLLYMEVSTDMQAQTGVTEVHKEVTNDEDYEVQGTLNMLMQIHSADDYRMFVAPFDINNVYVIELLNEADIENLDKTTALQMQNEAAKQFYDYLTDYIKPTDNRPTSMSLLSIINNYLKNISGSGIYKLEHFTGNNYYTASYYLYGVKSSTDEDEWNIVDDELIAEWEAVPNREIIMERGRTYAMNFIYCPKCTNFTGYDYWTDKFILFEGEGPQTIYGDDAVEQSISLRKGSTNTARFVGNASLKNVNASNVFTYNNVTNLYTRQTSTELRPTESAIFSDARDTQGRLIRAISRDGHMEYDDEPWEGTETSLGNLQQGQWQAQGAYGELLIRTNIPLNVAIYTATGQQIRQQYLQQTETLQLPLPQGVYIVAGNGKIEKVVVR